MSKNVWDAFLDLEVILNELAEDMFWESRERFDPRTGSVNAIPQCIFCGLVYGMEQKHNPTCLVERARRVLNERKARAEVKSSER